MPLLSPVRFFSLRCLLVVGLLSGQANAAELGEPVVLSFIGQPLVADIELVSMSPEEALGVQARVARPDVFQGANISMSPVLNSLRVTVARRDGRVFLHITSILPVEADYLHLFLELAAGGSSDVRSALLWLTRDPRPAVPLAAPAQAPGPAMPALLHAPAAGAAAAGRAAPSAAADHAATMAAARRYVAAGAAEGAPAHGTAPAPAHGAAPAAAMHGPNPMAAGRAAPAEHAAMSPVAGMGPRRALPAAIRNDPLFAEAMALAKECEALDARNAALTGQIVQLEGRLSHLQAVLAPKQPRPVIAASPHGADAAGSSAAASAKGAKADPKKTDYSRWYLIGGGAAGLLALIAAGVVMWRRKGGKFATLFKFGKGKAKGEKREPSADGEAPADGEGAAADDAPAKEEKRKKPSLWARLRLMWMLRAKAKQAG